MINHELSMENVVAETIENEYNAKEQLSSYKYLINDIKNKNYTEEEDDLEGC